MHTTMAIIALTMGATAGKLSQTEPTWLNNYSEAQRRVASVQKPMAVFFGSGQDGWKKVVKDGLDPALQKMLAQKFVCVYVDAGSAEGKALAEQFGVADLGLVVSDRTGSSQAFNLSGTLARAELRKELTAVAQTDRPPTSTKTVVRKAPARRTSPPPAPRTTYRPTYLPTYRSGST